VHVLVCRLSKHPLVFRLMSVGTRHSSCG